MTPRSVETEQDRKALIRFIESRKLPFTATINQGRKRTLDQNRLQRKWMLEIAAELGEDPEYWRGYCKLVFGVRILKAEDEKFAAVYDQRIRPLEWEHKLALMQVPLDLPITRLMSTKQHAAYLDAIYKHFTEQGVVLTDPEMFGLEAA